MRSVLIAVQVLCFYAIQTNMILQVFTFIGLAAFASAGLSYNSGSLGSLGGSLGGGLGSLGGSLGNLGGGLGISSGGIGGDSKSIKIVEFYTKPKYEYKYEVHDPKTGDIKEQKEERVGDKVRGEYSLKEPDGTIRVVKYEADKENGFNAKVERKGHAIHPYISKKDY